MLLPHSMPEPDVNRPIHAASSQRMSRVDTAWLRMDSDVNLMTIVGIWLLEPAITLDACRERVADRLLRFGRFKQKVLRDAEGASWVDDEDFDLAHHVVAERLPRRRDGGPHAALQALCARLACEPLDPSRPLWKFHLIEQYGGGSALVARLHHCIGDGIALISVMLAITDGAAEPVHPHGHDIGHEGDWLTRAVLEPLTGAALKALGLYGGGDANSLDLLSDPRQALFGSVDLAKVGVKLIADAAALALMPDDSPTLFKGKPGGRKRVAWNEPIALDAVKAVGRALGCSVNDVLLACVAGALGGYLAERGDDPAAKSIRAMVPVNLRPPEQAWQLGNRFGLAPLELPIGIANPVERVYAVHRRMDELKHSYQPLLAYGVLALAGHFTKPAQDAILGLFARKATAVMTNVPGPITPLGFCGSTLKQSIFWVPASGDIGLGLSVLSYGGGVQLALVTDHRLCPQPQAIIDRFEPEFEHLLTLTLMLPWPGIEAG